jgi:hypothetical protein
MVLLFLLILASVSFSHGEEEHTIEEIHSDPWAYIGIPNPMDILYISAIISGLGIFYAVFLKTASEPAKKVAFLVIAIPIALSTLYLSGATVYLNSISETGGPVHWHADFEIWVCGDKLDLIDPEGLSNKVGSPAVHEHNDSRIHIEGVLVKRQEASLNNFFMQVGGNLNERSITIPTNKGTEED